jgi:hypothetical protein
MILISELASSYIGYEKVNKVYLDQWFPTFLRIGSSYKSKINLGSTMMV